MLFCVCIEPVVVVADVVLLGAETTLRCEGEGGQSVDNDVIQWVNGSTDQVISTATNVSHLDLLLRPATLSDNNTQYYCVITNHITGSPTTVAVQG